MDPFDLDWGAVTPEAYDSSQNQAVHVLNIYMLTPEARRLAQIFLSGRVVWYSRHLPPRCSHRVRIDTRGQSVAVETLNRWRESVLSDLRQKLPETNVAIEFLA